MKKLSLTVPIVVPEPDGTDSVFDEVRILISLGPDQADVNWALQSSVSGKAHRSDWIQYPFDTIPASVKTDIEGLFTKVLSDLTNKVHARLTGTVVDS